jgi:hypothetical protein
MAHIVLKDMRLCSKHWDDGHPCTIPATVYAGGKHAGDWADYYCYVHKPQEFQVWDTFEYDLSDYARTSTTFSRNREIS